MNEERGGEDVGEDVGEDGGKDNNMECNLLLENGSVYKGEGFGYTEGKELLLGEVVFNTSMSGYQEILTDPSYKGQIVVMTYPHIGNYGVNEEDIESEGGIKVSGLVVREYEEYYSNYRGKRSLGDYLKEHKTLGLMGIDTRKLVKELRECGSLRGGLIVSASNRGIDIALLGAKISKWPKMDNLDLVKEVTRKKEDTLELGAESKGNGLKIVLIDYGIKSNIINNIVIRGCKVVVVSAHMSVEDILSYNPDGILLSNGPGDPSSVKYGIKTVEKLIKYKKPLFGICLGHQILSLALGGRTYKMKFGHRGGNHSVKNLENGKIEITAQNHGFAVKEDSLPKDVYITHINTSDETVEGISHKHLPIFSIQYHPESSPGPHDSKYLFDKFISLCLNNA